MHAVLVNPNLVFQRNDPFTTGIVYMPIGLAYTAAALRHAGFEVTVIDAFGQDPRRMSRDGKFTVAGIAAQETAAQVPGRAAAVFVYANQIANHLSVIDIIRAVKQRFPDKPVVVLENTQAVTAYALRLVAEEFYAAGADYILSGEGELRAVKLLRTLGHGNIRDIDGLGSREFYDPPVGKNEHLDDLPLPAWDLFPIENYWRLYFAHGPLSRRRYLPILTSRGCPYPCTFCVVPETNQHTWRARSAKNVVDEMAYFQQRFKVDEFHIEDLDPTISDSRIQQICRQILERGLKVVWKIASGTKVETIRSEETVELMAQAGCRYVSISPETGSPRLLKLMGKPFDIEHAVKMVRHMSRNKISTQACFVLGYPGETNDDRRMTKDLVRRLTQEGIDEIALFIITPVPGSAIYGQFKGYRSLSELNFTPSWRDDYPALVKFRLKLYAQFLLWKLRYHPVRILRQVVNFVTKHFETKMEMVPYRAMKLVLWSLCARQASGIPKVAAS